MKRTLLIVMPFFGLSNVTLVMAEECVVSENAVTCNESQKYDPNKYNGKQIHTYETVTFNTESANQHGYMQYSNHKVFNDVVITTKGNTADGVRVANWSPKLEFNDLTVYTQGASADGINLGRDTQNGTIIVNGQTTITTEDGIAVRAVAGGAGAGDQSIILKGSSQIITRGGGSSNSGYGIYAGNDYILGTMSYQALGKGIVYLLGERSDLHAIITSGNNAHGLYASGWGQIVANNIDVTTDGLGAHGIVAERKRGITNKWKQYDFAGTVELRGNISINVQDKNAFSLLADSQGSNEGKDSEGNIASIRSFNSETGEIVKNKIYTIHGNMRATRYGLIDLWVGNQSYFRGSTQISENGTLNLYIAGEQSLWDINGDSSFSEITLAEGATLRAVSEDGHPVSYTLNGRLINDGGVIDLTHGGIAQDQFIIQGHYTGKNGAIMVIDTVLAKSGAESDRIINDGGVIDGQTLLRVNNVTPGFGDATSPGHGIKLVRSINGGLTHDDAFILDENAENAYQHQGDTVIGDGAYAYSLHKGANPNVVDHALEDDYGETDIAEDWYLRSRYITSDTRQYSAGTAIYEVYPQFLLALNQPSTLKQRVGDNRLEDEGNHPNIRVWSRIEGSHAKVKPATSTTGAHYDYDRFKVQVGLDNPIYLSDNGQLVAGIIGHYVHGKADIYSLHGNGSIKTDGYGLSGTLTWYGQSGFYLDGQAQMTWYKSDLRSSHAGRTLVDNNKGFGYGFSIEAGQQIILNQQWSFTPQAQLTYSKIDFDRFVDQFNAHVSRQKAESLEGRLGMSIDYEVASVHGQSRDRKHLYGIVNVSNEFLDGTKVNVSDIGFSNRRERLQLEVGMGGALNWNNGRYSLFGEAGVKTTLKNFGDSYHYKATLGFRMEI